MFRLLVLFIIASASVFAQPVIDYEGKEVDLNHGLDYSSFSHYSRSGSGVYYSFSMLFPYSQDWITTARSFDETGPRYLTAHGNNPVVNLFMDSIRNKAFKLLDYWKLVLDLARNFRTDLSSISLTQTQKKAFETLYNKLYYVVDPNYMFYIYGGTTIMYRSPRDPEILTGNRDYKSQGILFLNSYNMEQTYLERRFDDITSDLDISPSGTQIAYVSSTISEPRIDTMIDADLFGGYTYQTLKIHNIFSNESKKIELDMDTLLERIPRQISREEFVYRVLDVKFINEDVLLLEVDYGRLNDFFYQDINPILGIMISKKEGVLAVYPSYYNGIINKNGTEVNHSSTRYHWDLTKRFFIQEGKVFEINNYVDYREMNREVGRSGVTSSTVDATMSLLPNPTVLYTLPANSTFTIIDTYEGPTGFNEEPAKYYKILPENSVAGWVPADAVVMGD